MFHLKEPAKLYVVWVMHVIYGICWLSVTFSCIFCVLCFIVSKKTAIVGWEHL